MVGKKCFFLFFLILFPSHKKRFFSCQTRPRPTHSYAHERSLSSAFIYFFKGNLFGLIAAQVGVEVKVGGLSLTRFGAAHPMAAESAVITPRAPMAPANTCAFREEKGRSIDPRTAQFLDQDPTRIINRTRR